MATVKEGTRTTFELSYQRGDDFAGRTISFDYLEATTPEGAYLQTAAQAVARSLVGGFSTFIQPTGWRDSDVEEEAWAVTSVVPKITTTTEVTFDEVTP